MLENKIADFKKLYSNLVVTASTVAILTASALTMNSCSTGCSSTDNKTRNNKAYVLTVNSENKGVVKKLGWTKSPGKSDDYAIYDGSLDEFKEEFGEKDYSILAITGHHNSYGGNFVYDDDGEKVKFKSLPESKNLEVVVFSACATAGTDGETIENVYLPLINKYSNLKAITGFTTTSLKDDGVTPKILLSTSKKLLSSTEEYAKKSVQINPDRVGTLVKVGDKRWDYYSKEGVTHLKIYKNKYKILD